MNTITKQLTRLRSGVFKTRIHNISNIPMSRNIASSINLTETEQNIKNILVQFADTYNENVSPKEQLELRITGGWVRDKLLGKESNDIDIAVNVLSGQDFATQLLEYVQLLNIDLGHDATSLHTIKKNPEKSKHLETCTTKLYGLNIDFVNLRSEQYTEDSRVPIIECGTAEEDALRRDATLNALFYNLNEEKIEDFTGKGIDDLSQGILRTPLQPLQTFLDDPLRVLRLIRFASRFNFIIEEETLHAMEDERMKETLVHKISRERVGVETEKVLTSHNVPYGLRLINYVGLTSSIFNAGTLTTTVNDINVPEVREEIEAEDELVVRRLDAATQVFGTFVDYLGRSGRTKFAEMFERVLNDNHLRKLFWLCTTLQPYGLLAVKINPKKQALSPYVEVILKEGLRFGRQDYDPATSIVKSIHLSKLLETFFRGEGTTRADLGMYIRTFGEYFEVNLVVNAFNHILQATEGDVAQNIHTMPTPNGAQIAVDDDAFTKVVENYEKLLSTISQQNLEDVSLLKPLVDGKVLSKALQRKPGPWMSKITSEVLRWQLDNPDGSQEECIDHIREFLRGST